MNCDVLVIGSGAAGLTAALKASVAGLKVIVIEKEPLIGGTTALSEGMIWVPVSNAAIARSKGDTREEALAYLLGAAGPQGEPERAAAYVDGAAEMLAFVHTHSELRFTLSSASIDYHQELRGATRGARAFNPGIFDGRKLGSDLLRLRPPLPTTLILGGMTVASADLPYFLKVRRSPAALLHVAGVVARYGLDRARGHPRGTRIANGNGLVAALLFALKGRGIDVHTYTRASRLTLGAGRVTGAETVTGGRIEAARGVILGCGGFPASPEMRRLYYNHVAAGQPHHSLAPDSNTGDGIGLGLEAGGALNEYVAQPAAWTPVSLVPQALGPPVPFPHYMDRGKPGVVAVTRHGRRFANEAETYHRFVPAMLRAALGESEAAVWLIADHRAVRSYGLGAAPPAPGRLAPFLKSGYLARAATLAELGAALGIDAQALSRTIGDFNAHAGRGEDPDFGKGSSAYNRANGDPAHRPNPCLAPLETPPFYAVKVFPGDIATFVGLKTDSFARVLTAQDKPVAGLYAAGNDAASCFGGDYPAAGITIGSAMTFGYLAARHISAGR